MTDTTVSTTDRIRALNDDFRRSFVGGLVVITAGVEAMPAEQRRSLLAKVRAFDVFTEDNDPRGEHDFGAIDEGSVRYSWKVDCYDRATEFGSPDPADPAAPPAYDHHARRRILNAQRTRLPRVARGVGSPRSQPSSARSAAQHPDGDAKARRCPPSQTA
jgi:hypothetical protein